MTAHASHTARRSFGLAWVAAGLWTGVILAAGSDIGSYAQASRYLGPFLRWLLPDWPQPRLDQLYSLIREAAHVAEYGVLAVLAQWAWHARLPATAARFAAALAWVLVLACADEMRQAFTPSRTGSIGDVGLDLGGGLLALAIVFAYTRAMRPGRAGGERR